MSSWTHVIGTQKKQPEELEKSITGLLYVRRNITAVADTANNDSSSEENHVAVPGWEYDEIVLTPEEYDKFLDLTVNPFYKADTSSLKDRILNIETFIASSTE